MIHNHLAPYELIGLPFDVWLADVADDGTVEPMPDMDAAVPAEWTRLGASGDENIVGDGVKVTFNQAFKEHKPPSRLTPTRVFRTLEQSMIDLQLADMRAEVHQIILNGNTLVDAAATNARQARRSVPLRRGFGAVRYSLLVRGAGSPYFGTSERYGAQLWIPAVYYSTEAPEFTGRVDDGAMALPMQFKSLEARVQANVARVDALGRLEFAVPSVVSTLSALVPSAGNLNPAFAPATLAYALAVPDGTASITLTPTITVDSRATVTVDGRPVASGAESQAVNTPVGETIILVVGTAEDDTTTTYTVAVTRNT